VILRKNKNEPTDQLRYSQIVGSLMYLASATRPDISFAMSKLSRFMSNPGIDLWHALERVMRYLCDTISYEIHYLGHPAVLEGYSDANWISDLDDIKATSGYVVGMTYGACQGPSYLPASVPGVSTALEREDRLHPKDRLRQQPAGDSTEESRSRAMNTKALQRLSHRKWPGPDKIDRGKGRE
jgi:hypothetical protein